MHRSLGVHLSFVRSCTMDAWSDREMEIMRVGGNKAMRDFFTQQNFPKSLSIEQKYHSEAAALYRERIKALADGADARTLKSIPIIGYTEAGSAGSSATTSSASAGMASMGSKPSRSDSFGSSSNGSRQDSWGSSGGGGESGGSYGGGSYGGSSGSGSKMQGFGSNGQSYGSHVGSDSSSADFFNTLSSSFFSAAKYTQQAVANTAAVVGPKLSQAGASLKARAGETSAELGKADIVQTAAAKTAQGWNSITSFVSGVVTGGTTGTEPIPKPGKYQSFGSDNMDADGNLRPNPPPTAAASASSSDSSDYSNGSQGLFGISRPESIGTGKKYDSIGSDAFQGFDDDEEQSQYKPAASMSTRNHQKSPNANKTMTKKSILAQAMEDNETTSKDDADDGWGWNDNTTTTNNTTAKPTSPTSFSSSTSPRAPSSSTSPTSPHSHSSGNSRKTSDVDDHAPPTKQLRGMKLTNNTAPTTTPTNNTQPITASSSSLSTASKKKTSILAQIHDDDDVDGKKDDFEGFDDW